MASNLSLNTSSLWQPYLKTTNTGKDTSNVTDNTSNTGITNYQSEDGTNKILNSLLSMATQNGYNAGNVSGNSASVDQVAQMLQAGNKQEVKDELGAAAVPALMAIVKDTKQPMQVRTDAIATLAKLVDEGKAPASCLVSLLKDPNTKDMAERAMANVGKEIMPIVKQMLNGSDPALKESAKNILNDMVDAWSGYENDPKWGQECRELLPEVNSLLEKVNGNAASTGSTSSTSGTSGTSGTSSGSTEESQTVYDYDDPENPINFAGYNRQFVQFNKFSV